MPTIVSSFTTLTSNAGDCLPRISAEPFRKPLWDRAYVCYEVQDIVDSRYSLLNEAVKKCATYTCKHKNIKNETQPDFK